MTPGLLETYPLDFLRAALYLLSVVGAVSVGIAGLFMRQLFKRMDSQDEAIKEIHKMISERFYKLTDTYQELNARVAHIEGKLFPGNGYLQNKGD